jgi:hypothetical protein
MLGASLTTAAPATLQRAACNGWRQLCAVGLSGRCNTSSSAHVSIVVKQASLGVAGFFGTLKPGAFHGLGGEERQQGEAGHQDFVHMAVGTALALHAGLRTWRRQWDCVCMVVWEAAGGGRWGACFAHLRVVG